MVSCICNQALQGKALDKLRNQTLVGEFLADGDGRDFGSLLILNGGLLLKTKAIYVLP